MANYPNYFYSYTLPNNPRTMEWVDGEAGAEAFPMPVGWPVNAPIALWDSAEKKIFLKSWNQMGVANPLQEIDYEIKERQAPEQKYVTKEEFNELRKEIRNLQNNNRNRGGQQ